jgi:hypothetical protein
MPCSAESAPMSTNSISLTEKKLIEEQTGPLDQ